MHFLLVGINSKYIHMNPAVYSIYAYTVQNLPQSDLKSGGVTLDVCEYTINQSMDEILADLYRQKPDVVGFSCYIWNWRMIRELMVELKKLLPQTDLYLGGPEVSYEAENLIREYGTGNGQPGVIRGILLGEGEETFFELVKAYQNGETRLKEIPGLLLETGYTGERQQLDFNTLPFLYQNLPSGSSGFDALRNKILYYESSRGCPFRCSYCLSSVDKRVRLRDLSVVLSELQFFLDQKVEQVKFIDRTFNCNKNHALSIWKYLIEHDNGVTNFHFEIAAELLDEEELTLLRQMRPGLVQLEIGVQTTNKETLKEINRNADLVHLARVVAEIQKGKNIHVHLDLIAGLPKEDYERFQTSFNQIYEMEPEQLQLGFLKVLKGTQMSLNRKEYGLVSESEPPYEVLYTKWISYEEIRKLKRIEEMMEIYYNSNQFRNTMRMLVQKMKWKNPKKAAFGVYESLADYYENHGYFVNTPARAYRYDVLLQFACEQFPEHRELWRELLTFDYYLRENAKSRPAFCSDQPGDYQKIWNYYQWEEQKRRYLPEYEGYHARQVMKMTHMEKFTYPVWEHEKPDKLQMPVYVLFDYQQRSPLTGDAAITKLRLDDHSEPELWEA